MNRRRKRYRVHSLRDVLDEHKKNVRNRDEKETWHFAKRDIGQESGLWIVLTFTTKVDARIPDKKKRDFVFENVAFQNFKTSGNRDILSFCQDSRYFFHR